MYTWTRARRAGTLYLENRIRRDFDNYPKRKRRKFVDKWRAGFRKRKSSSPCAFSCTFSATKTLGNRMPRSRGHENSPGSSLSHSPGLSTPETLTSFGAPDLFSYVSIAEVLGVGRPNARRKSATRHFRILCIFKRGYSRNYSSASQYQARVYVIFLQTSKRIVYLKRVLRRF